jgi:hypothetical protein
VLRERVSDIAGSKDLEEETMDRQEVGYTGRQEYRRKKKLERQQERRVHASEDLEVERSRTAAGAQQRRQRTATRKRRRKDHPTITHILQEGAGGRTGPWTNYKTHAGEDGADTQDQ